MPFIGHREPDLADLGISPADRAAPTPVLTPHELRTVALVDRVATDAADRQTLLEALGLAVAVADRTPLAS